MAGMRRRQPSSIKTGASKRAKTIDLGWKGDDDEVDSEDDFFDDKRERDHGPSSDEEEEETVEAKKVRLAREYLQKIEKVSDESTSEEEEEESEGEEGEERDRLGVKLQRQRQKREGTLERVLADKIAQRIETIKLDIIDERRRHKVKASETEANFKLNVQQQAKEWVDTGYVNLLKGHDLTTTCVGLQADGSRAVSGSKDHSIILWDIENEISIVKLWDNWKKRGDSDIRTEGQVISIACSDDGRYAAVGRRDATVSIFDLRQTQKVDGPVKTFTGHKSAVTSLAFRSQSLQLFSGSDDRCIRHYSLDEMIYMETLYGHQFGVTGIDCHRKERPISVGRDRTARAWKLQEDTHLIFRGGGRLSSADCVSVIKDDWFLTGHENGQLSLWMTEKKKAVAAVEYAHGKINDLSGGQGNSIASISSLKGSDLACTGSHDGYLRLWKVKTGQTVEERGLEPLSHIPVYGYINDIAVGPKAKFCVFALGQEPRLGRWDRVPKAKNRFGILKLQPRDTEGSESSSHDEESNKRAYNEPAGVESFADEDGSD